MCFTRCLLISRSKATHDLVKYSVGQNEDPQNVNYCYVITISVSRGIKLWLALTKTRV